MKVTTIGLDIAKRVFALYWVEADSGEIKRRTLRRSQMLLWFARRERCVVAMEACGSAHYWGRELSKLGHEVRLLAPKFVRAFVKTNKTDAADAQAIWECSQRPGMHTVALKSETQQSVLALHRVREQQVKMRSMYVNQLRGLMAEYGVELPLGRVAGLKQAGALLTEPGAVPELLRPILYAQLEQVRALDARIEEIERALGNWAKAQPGCVRVDKVPGVGELTATAALASMGEPEGYGSGRGFAASLGLVPAQSGTGGKVHLLKISKRGDPYLRKLLIHGARSVVSAHRRKTNKGAEPQSQWLDRLLERRPFNVVVVAVANKMARTIWALVAHDCEYNPNHRSVRPA
jgi:transposase